eukprot:gene287-301_t
MPLSISTSSSSASLASPSRTPPGGFQTFTFSDEPELTRSLTPRTNNRSAKKMTKSPNQSSMKNLLQMSAEGPLKARKATRVSPGGNTTIQECFKNA